MTRRFGRAFYRGDDKTITFASTVDSVALDITGATFLAQVRATPGGAVLLTLDVQISDAAGGEFALTFAPADGVALLGIGESQPFVGWYDIQRTLSSVVTTLVYGQIEILPDISRA